MAERKRKANGESTIYFGADGWWHGRVTVGVKADGSEDRRHRRGRTEDEVKAKVEALERARDSGPLPKAGRVPTVAKWFDEFLNTICVRRVEDGSMAPRTLGRLPVEVRPVHPPRHRQTPARSARAGAPRSPVSRPDPSWPVVGNEC
ncbi:hypothetical protein ACU686_02785 [Yinghuangia aomiensis]